MPSRQEVYREYQRAGDYHEVARRLGMPAGTAYMIVTGRPADTSDADPPEEGHRPGMIRTSTQSLVYANQPPVNPTAKPVVGDWLRSRAAADGQMRRAWLARTASD